MTSNLLFTLNMLPSLAILSILVVAFMIGHYSIYSLVKLPKVIINKNIDSLLFFNLGSFEISLKYVT